MTQTATPTPTPTRAPAPAPTPARAPLGHLRHHWATLAGAAVAALMISDLAHGADVAPVVAAAAVVYLGAAALRNRAATWPLLAVAIVVMLAADAVGADRTWVLLALGGALAVLGLLRGAARPAHGLPLQGLALLVFGAAAALTPALGHEAGAYLIAAALLAHAGWDAYHHRRDRVVARSLAEFCLVLDTLVAVALVLVTALG